MIKKAEFWSEKIPFIKKLKDFYSKIEYRGVNLWAVMAGDVYTYYYFSHIDKEEEPNTKERILINLKSLFFKDRFPLKNPEGKILISYFMPRKDHHELVKKAVSKFPEKDIIWIDAFEYKQKNILLRGKIFFPDIFTLFNIWKKFRKTGLKNILKNYYWFYILKTYFRYNQIKEFKKIMGKIKPRIYISFCSSAFAEESILTLLCKKNKIPTFTLQHGFLPKPSDSFTSVIIQNENMVSDYFLLWGKYSYDIMKNYVDDSNLILAGNPKYELMKKEPKPHFIPKNATIFFSATGFNEGNFKLLEIAKKFIENHPEISFNITVHPMNDLNLFSKHLNYNNVKIIPKDITSQTLLKESDFVILYNTSVILEALNYKIPIFIYKGKKFLNFWNSNEDTFTSLKELEALFLKMKNGNEYKKILDFYDKELRKNFYFHHKKSVSEVYYEEIIEKVNKRKLQ